MSQRIATPVFSKKLDLTSLVRIYDSSHYGIERVPGLLHPEFAALLRDDVAAYIKLKKRVRPGNMGYQSIEVTSFRRLPTLWLLHQAYRAVYDRVGIAAGFAAGNSPNVIELLHYDSGIGQSMHSDGPIYHDLIGIASLGAKARMEGKNGHLFDLFDTDFTFMRAPRSAEESHSMILPQHSIETIGGERYVVIFRALRPRHEPSKGLVKSKAY